MQETWVRSLSWEDPLEKEMATHASILAWEIPWTEEPGRLQVPGVTTAHLSKNAPGLQYTKLGAFWLQFFKLTSLQAEEQPYQVPSALP